MGLMDRDYMHEPHKRPTRLKRFTALRSTLKFGVLAGIFFWLGSQSAQWDIRLPASEPFPATGHALWFGPFQTQDLAPLTVIAPPNGDALHAVVLLDPKTQRLLGVVPLRAGEKVSVQVPLGQYELVLASGTSWYGPEKLFGLLGSKEKALKSLHFARSAGGFSGHVIDLNRKLDGNLHTRPAPFESYQALPPTR